MNRREHLLVILAEEASEVQKVIAKILRFGPNSDYDGITNREKLQNEFNDFLGVAELLKEEGIVVTRDTNLVIRKQDKVEKFLLDSKRIGTLEDDNN